MWQLRSLKNRKMSDLEIKHQNYDYFLNNLFSPMYGVITAFTKYANLVIIWNLCTYVVKVDAAQIL